jgi:3'-phosphoadenosine 5'-phosphosulfate (PAPS) 3'-phosphatase
MEQIYGVATTQHERDQLEFPDEFYEDDMVIWIDPLDGTKGFTEGHLNHVTSMIGVSIEGRPRIGVIHKLFYKQALRQGRTYFGTPECGIFIEDKFPNQMKRLHKFASLAPFPSEDCI